MATIYMSLEDINTNITKINAAKETITSQWSAIKTDDVEKIKASWIGTDCNAYIEKIMEMDTQMQNAIAALQLLGDTYTSAKNQILSTQQNVASSVSNL